jgi:hypothetical protein
MTFLLKFNRLEYNFHRLVEMNVFAYAIIIIKQLLTLQYFLNRSILSLYSMIIFEIVVTEI